MDYSIVNQIANSSQMSSGANVAAQPSSTLQLFAGSRDVGFRPLSSALAGIVYTNLTIEMLEPIRWPDGTDRVPLDRELALEHLSLSDFRCCRYRRSCW